MNSLVSLDKSAPMTMSSREIAELTGKNHADVMRDIRIMVDQLTKAEMLSCANSTTYAGKDGRQYPQYELDKDTSLTLLLGYDAVARMKVVKRWQQLEESSGHLIPDFSNPAEAARAWAIQYEEKTKAIAIAEEAIRTKAEIGSKREATAMATASIASKKAERLSIEVDESRNWATIKRMEMAYHGTKFKWQELRNASNEMGIPPRKIFDANYGTVNSYHADAWREAYALEII